MFLSVHTVKKPKESTDKTEDSAGERSTVHTRHKRVLSDWTGLRCGDTRRKETNVVVGRTTVNT